MKIGPQTHRSSAISSSNEATILVRGRDLNDAGNSELRQQLNYQRELIDFQRLQITL